MSLDVLNSAVFTDLRLRLRYRHSGTTEPRTYTLDPYGLVVKAGVWYLVADHRTRPRLFRADRVVAATLTDAPVRRRAGQELADVWEVLRRQVEDRPADVRVTARVRADHLDLFLRIHVGRLAAEPVTQEVDVCRTRAPGPHGGPRAAHVRRECGGALAARGPRGAGPRGRRGRRVVRGRFRQSSQ